MAQRALTRVPVFPLTRAAPRGEGLFLPVKVQTSAGRGVEGLKTNKTDPSGGRFRHWLPAGVPPFSLGLATRQAARSSLPPHSNGFFPCDYNFILLTFERKVNRFSRLGENFKKILISPIAGGICPIFEAGGRIVEAVAACSSPDFLTGKPGEGWCLRRLQSRYGATGR